MSKSPKKETASKPDIADAIEGLIGGPAAIIAQECRGQREVAMDDQLPSDCSAADKRALEAAGVRFGEPVDGDPLFVHAHIPEGWSKKAMDHAMYSQLLDAQGRVRATIGYKGAAYDRWANLRAANRLRAIYTQWDDYDRSSPVYPLVEDSNGNVLWSGEGIAQTDGLHETSTDSDLVFSSHVAGDKAEEVMHAAFPMLAEADQTIKDGKDLGQAGEGTVDSAIAIRFQLLWDLSDEEIKERFPKSESEPPKGDEYKLYVEIYHDTGCRQFADGGHSDTRKFETLEAAIEKFMETARYHVRSYGACKIRITKDDEMVFSKTVTAQRKTPRYADSNGRWGKDDNR